MKKLLIFTLIIISIFSMSSCGLISEIIDQVVPESLSNSVSIVGKWESEEGYISGDYGALDELEFFEDSTYSSNSPHYTGNYSISGNRIKLQGYIASTKTFTFKASRDTLTFYDDDGELMATYKKVS